MRYDTTLKALFRQAPQRLFERLVNDTAQELFTVEFPTVRQRRPDLVIRLVGGGIFHLELQGTQPKLMLWRMLEYYMLLTLPRLKPWDSWGLATTNSCFIEVAQGMAWFLPVRFPTLGSLTRFVPQPVTPPGLTSSRQA